MESTGKGRSPFYPGQPVPPEFFAGRQAEIERVLTHSAAQVAQGKPIAVFVEGEYGIGKSSFAGYVQRVAEEKFGLHGVYATLGAVNDLRDLTVAVVEATLRSGTHSPKATEIIRNWLAKYIGQQELFGVTVNFEAIRQDVPKATTPTALLSFLEQTNKRLAEAGVRGIVLVLDEINGIAGDSNFPRFLKSLWDANALSRTPVPLLLMLCGTPERRRQLIQGHEPVGRIFDVVRIDKMSDQEMETFFRTAFASVHMRVDDHGMGMLVAFSGGLPKVMHLLGDAAYWTDKDGFVDENDSVDAVDIAAEELGRKYVDPQVYEMLQSKDYRSILLKLGQIESTSFHKSDLLPLLSASEKTKLTNFITKMKRLNVLTQGNERGEYVFAMDLVWAYLAMKGKKI